MCIRPLIALLTLSFLPFCAQGREARPGKPRGPQGIIRQLDLTETQRTKIAEIRARHQAQIQTQRQKAGEARKALKVALKNPKTPVTELKQLHHRAEEARFDLQLARREQRQEIATQLTPEQREKAAALRGFARGRRTAGHRQG